MTRTHIDQRHRHMADCFICRQQFQFGPHIGAGRWITPWRLYLCRLCISSNHDGIVIECHKGLDRHLAEQGVEIRLNARGWLDIPSIGSR